MNSTATLRFISISAAAIILFGPLSGADKKIQYKTITLEEAVQTALKNNTDYITAGLRARQADERVNAAWGQLMPALESEASVTRQNADTGFMSLSDGQYDIRLAQARFGLNPGAFYHTLEAARSGYVSAREDLRRIKSEVEFSVIKSYFDLMIAGEMISLRKDSHQVLKSNQKDVESQFRNGAVPKFDLLQAKVQAESQAPLLAEAESNYIVALDLFNYNLGLDHIEYEADRSILMLDISGLKNSGQDKIIEQLSITALRNRPEIMQLTKKRDAAAHAEDANASAYIWPTFYLAGSYGMTKSDPNPIPGVPPAMSQISGSGSWETNWQVRAAATYRWGALIPADRSRALEREEALKVKEAEAELAKLKRLTAITVRSAYSRLVTSSQNIKTRKENVATAEEGLRIAREGYRAGIIKNSDLLAAELSLTNARTGYINSLHSYYTSLAELKKAVGTDKLNLTDGEK